MHIFKKVQEQEKKPTIMVQMSIIKRISEWTSKLAKKHIVI
jgi:hypothetical protein